MKANGALRRAPIQEHAIVFCSNVVCMLHNCKQSDICLRLSAKFKESNSEKLKRVCALYSRYDSKVLEAERELDLRVKSLEERVKIREAAGIGDYDDSDDTTAHILSDIAQELSLLRSEEVHHAARLQGGLEILQHLALLASFAMLIHSSHASIAINVLARGTGGNVEKAASSLLGTLRELCVYLGSKKDDTMASRKRKDLIGWIARLKSIVAMKA